MGSGAFEFSSCLYMPQEPSRLERINTALLSGVHAVGDDISSVNVIRRGVLMLSLAASNSATYTVSRSEDLTKASFLPSAVPLRPVTQNPAQLVKRRGSPMTFPVRSSTHACRKLQLNPWMSGSPPT